MNASKNHDESTVDGPARVSVIICAFTLDRWELLNESVHSVVEQDQAPFEVFLCIDHNPEMFARCVAEMSTVDVGVPWELQIVQNRFDTRLGGARTTAAELATGDILVFLDDDAAASPSWLRTLTKHYEDRNIVAVGGAPVARYQSERPRWLPFECNWIFGCAYRGLPERVGPIDHMIGANMSVRREVLMSWGGFQSDNHDDMDLSHRAIHAHGQSSVIYDPSAIVHHFVPAARLTWTYFWRRCFFVNRGKASAFRGLDEASNLNAEIRFAVRSLGKGVLYEGGALLGGDWYAPVRYGALITALALGGTGALVGRLQ
jgi:cellulose synthase/poly-beta-1,6-N-acetylglucosamine synthase-like glycosyltransferase